MNPACSKLLCSWAACSKLLCSWPSEWLLSAYLTLPAIMKCEQTSQGPSLLIRKQSNKLWWQKWTRNKARKLILVGWCLWEILNGGCFNNLDSLVLHVCVYVRVCRRGYELPHICICQSIPVTVVKWHLHFKVTKTVPKELRSHP